MHGGVVVGLCGAPIIMLHNHHVVCDVLVCFRQARVGHHGPQHNGGTQQCVHGGDTGSGGAQQLGKHESPWCIHACAVGV